MQPSNIDCLAERAGGLSECSFSVFHRLNRKKVFAEVIQKKKSLDDNNSDNSVVFVCVCVCVCVCVRVRARARVYLVEKQISGVLLVECRLFPASQLRLDC